MNSTRQARPRSRRHAAPQLSLAVQFGIDSDTLPSRARLRTWAKAATEGNANVTLRLVGAREARKLNRDFRGRDYATNVLTFVYPELDPLSGDIVLCVPVIAREARAQRKTFDAHFAHLVVHGMLHLQGYDHENEADAGRMESREAEIVANLGYADPYGER